MRIIVLFILTISNFVAFSQKDTTILYPDGKVRYKGEMQNGKKLGTWYEYDKSGNKKNRIEIVNKFMVKITPMPIDSNVTEYFYGHFVADTLVMHGDYYRKDKMTNNVTEGKFFNGQFAGQWKSYVNGKLYDITGYRRDKNNKLYINFKKNGDVNFISYRKDNGVSHGLYIDFDDSSNVKEIGHYDNGCKIGEWLYYKNGRLESKGTYYPDYLQLKSFDSDTLYLVNKDKILAEKLYPPEVTKTFVINDQVLYLKDGKWEYYNTEGKLIRVEFYEKGKLIKTQDY